MGRSARPVGVFFGPLLYCSTAHFERGRRVYEVAADLTFDTGEEQITVPKGFLTDLASVPSFARAWFAPDGPWAEAAAVHDYLYRTPGHVCTRAEADLVFRQALQAIGTPAWRALAMYGSVRLFGHQAFLARC